VIGRGDKKRVITTVHRWILSTI